MTQQRYRLWQLGVVAAALVVRLPQLNGSFWLDEAAQALESARPLAQQFSLALDFQPPLFHLLVALLIRVSHYEWWLRLASLIPAVLTVWLTMRIARRSLGQGGSLVAGAAVAFSGLHVFFSQELRPYSLAVFWAAWSWDSFERGRWRQFSLAATAGLFTSYIFPFWLIFLLAVAAMKRQFKIAFGCLAVSGLFFLAWFPSFLEQLRSGEALRLILPGWENVVSFPPAKALVLVPAKFLTGVLTVDFAWRDVAAVGGTFLVLAAAAVTAWRESDRPRRAGARQWLLLLVGPLLAVWAVSFITPVIQPKRLLFLLPPAAVLLGWLAGQRLWLGRAAVGLFFAWQIFGLGAYWSRPQLQREDWRGAISQIDQQFSSANTAVVFGFSTPFAPWQWYPHQPYPTFSTGLSPIRDLVAAAQSLKGLERYRYVIVFDYLRDLTDPYRLIEARLAEMKYRRLGEFTYPNLGIIRVFEQNQLYAGAEDGPS